MKWTSKESALYLESKEYIDTALVPLIPLALDETLKESANANEFIQLITHQLEKQFKGRILLMPGLSYFNNATEEMMELIIENWVHNIRNHDIKHLFFISTDQKWKRFIEERYGEFIWIPSIPLEHLDDAYKMSVIDNQVKQLLNIFVLQWQETERNISE